MKTINLYVGTAAIDKAILSLHKRGQAIQNEMHKIALSVLSHVNEHKDVRVVGKMLSAMPEVSRTNALRAWFEHFGPVVFGDKDSIMHKPKNVNMQQAAETPFWKFQPEAAYQPIDVEAKLSALIKALTKDETETNRDHHDVINVLSALKAKVHKPDSPSAQIDPLSGEPNF
ncbi:hypothetical protein [Nostoc phage NMeng1]|nr:hypothetical protein [Nostoc phage NMeng1]